MNTGYFYSRFAWGLALLITAMDMEIYQHHKTMVREAPYIYMQRSEFVLYNSAKTSGLAAMLQTCNTATCPTAPYYKNAITASSVLLLDPLLLHRR